MSTRVDTAVRAIHLIFPLYVINWTAVKSLSATYTAIIGLTIVLLLVIKFVDFEESKNTEEASVAVYIQFVLLVSLFLTVVLLNVISFGKLYLCKPSRTETWRRTATVTVGIISLIFCVCNVGFVIIFGWRTVSVLSFLRMPHDQLLTMITYYILLPLNSACNPVVYLTRKKEMRLHVKTSWGKFVGCLCRKDGENDAENRREPTMMTADV